MFNKLLRKYNWLPVEGITIQWYSDPYSSIVCQSACRVHARGLPPAGAGERKRARLTVRMCGALFLKKFILHQRYLGDMYCPWSGSLMYFSLCSGIGIIVAGATGLSQWEWNMVGFCCTEYAMLRHAWNFTLRYILILEFDFMHSSSNNIHIVTTYE